MIRWCAYCQKYLGEKAPFDDYAVTHTICADCAASNGEALESTDRALELSAFYADLSKRALQNALPPLGEALQRAKELGVRPIDLLMGIIQPILYQIGTSWEDGSLSVAGEHAATAFFSTMTNAVRAADPGIDLMESRNPDVLLVNADGNYHTIGLVMVEVFLAMHGISSLLIHPGIPSSETIALCEALKPKALGISVSMEDHLTALDPINAWLEGRTNPVAVVGGFHIRTKAGGLRFSKFREAKSPQDLVDLIH